MTARVGKAAALAVAAAALLGAGAFLGARFSGAGSCWDTVSGGARLLDALACGKGDTAACQRTVATDHARCDRGEFQGCVLLGIAYQVGHSLPMDEALAVTYFRRACDGRDANGCWYLANCYEHGRGVTKDEAEARALDAKGCELGTDGNACDSSKQGFACEHAQRLRARGTR